MASGPGLLCVTAQPHDTLAAFKLHDWYNNEHGPVRLRLPFVVNGFRYRARGDAKPEWMAIYDITDVSELTRTAYTSLRDPQNKTQREIQTMKQLDMDRHIYDLIYTKQAREMRPDESGSVLVAVHMQVPAEHEAEVNQWYIDDHIPALAKTPGWLRSRRYRTSTIDDSHAVEYLALHEYASENGIGGPESRAAVTSQSYKDVAAKATSKRGPLFWDLAYTFGPAPRELAALWDPSTAEWSSTDARTKIIPGSQPAIESYVAVPDGVHLPYRLEGAADPEGPLVVLVNSILVDWGIWDKFVSAFLQHPDHKHFRVLRYNARGRYAAAGSRAVTLDVLTDDLIALLDALRVSQAACAIGVSLGGATVLNAALKHPNRLQSFVACDTNDIAPPSNPKAWDERIATAEQEGATGDGQRIVGDELAEKTTRRWFVEASYDGGAREAEADRVQAMVKTNSLEGFKAAVKALYSYDLQPSMRDGTVKGLFLVGGGDGVLPKTMAEMAQRYGSRAELVAIEDAGHLPMVEQPQQFTEAIHRFVSGT